MDGPSTPEVPSQQTAKKTVENKPAVPGVTPVTKDEAIKTLWKNDGGDEDPKKAYGKEHRVILDIRTNEVYIVKEPRDDMAPQNEVRHPIIAAQLKKDNLISDINDAVGCYAMIDNPPGGNMLMWTGAATSVDAIAGATEAEFNQAIEQLVSNPEEEENKIYLLDPKYGWQPGQ